MDIPEHEWQKVLELAGLTNSDEREDFGSLLLSCRGGVRRWAAATPSAIAIVNGEATTDEYQIGISRRLVHFAVSAVESMGTGTLTAHFTDENRLTKVEVSCSSGSLEVDANAVKVPNYFSIIERAVVDGIHAEIDSTDLQQALRSLLATRATSGALTGKLEINEKTLTIEVEWPDLGTAKYSINCSSTGTGSVEVDMIELFRLVDLHSGVLRVHVPRIEGDYLHLKSEGAESFQVPRPQGCAMLRPGVEDVIAKLFGPLAVHRDHDGDYRLVRRGAPVFGRLLEGRPPRFQVFVVLLDEVEASAELFQEMNDYNVGLGFVRVAHMDGQVWAMADLVASSLREDELNTAVERISSAAEMLAPMLQMRFGGETPPAEVARWESYISAVVMAELSPDKYVPLNGPSAVKDWPFQGAVYGITAWDPQGVHRSTKENEVANQGLVTDLLTLGLHFVQGYGVGMEDHDGEPGFIVWGTDRETARRLGSYYEQDAIFEVTDTTISVVSCFSDHVVSKPRLD